jgi:radical SAM protein with 4Fe4S-binding SPASM domain
VDPATGVLRGSAWRPLADPPDPERAAQAMREFEARPKGRRLFCHMPTLTLYVFYDGRVFPCCHPHAHTKLPMGDLSRQSFREIWNGRAYRNLRAGLELGDPPPLCQRCSLMQSPPPVMENPGELEGQAASLGSYYGELDLEPLPTGLELSAMGDSSGAADGGSGSEAPREALAREQRWHEAAVEREREVLVLHMRALETHIKNLEGERAHQLGHIKNLERILGKIHGIPIYRTLCKVKDAALFWAPRSRSISRSESESRSER